MKSVSDWLHAILKSHVLPDDKVTKRHKIPDRGFVRSPPLPNQQHHPWQSQNDGTKTN